ncbi:MAG TPA: phosphoribosyltransferase family protein [Gemmatimonadales bacterium]|nr:phosphoribosyltransferase family protein [Gemmatimonadales bacterium]
MPPSVPRWSELRAAFDAVERWLLPGECLLCHAAVEANPRDPLICAPCRTRWSSLPLPQCSRCGQPLTPAIDCRLCAEWPPGLRDVRSAVWLDDSARRAVHLLKYEGWWRVSESMATAICRWLSFERGIALIPIPLGAARLRSRGYNQSAVLAEALAKRLGVPVASAVLTRSRETTTQTALTPEARRANLAGAFVARTRAPARSVLVDDVFTTGATLLEAATALLAAGAETVSGVTFARAARPLAGAAAAPDPPQNFWSAS